MVLSSLKAWSYSNITISESWLQLLTDSGLHRYKLNFAEIEQGRPATVKDAAVAFKEICYEYRFDCFDNQRFV